MTLLNICQIKYLKATVIVCLLFFLGEITRNFSYAESLTPSRQGTHNLTEKREKTEAYGSANESSVLIDQIAGVYKHRFDNELVDGTTYQSEDILEIVKVEKDIIYFKIHLNFYNGHECGLYGTAMYTKNKSFLFRDTSDDIGCSLEIMPTPEGILLLDGVHGGNECRSYHCGARGSFDNTLFKKSARRAIRYMKRLKQSTDYKESIKKLEVK